jgi:hypothetical protein
MCAALFVGFSYDRRFFVLVLILLVFFVLLIIVVRISRRRMLTSVLLTDQVETFSGMCGVMSAPVSMLGRSG